MNRIVSKLDDCVGISVEELVLHREPMLFLDVVVACAGESTECDWRVSAGDPFVVPGKGIPSYIGIEHMAQCVAAHAGARERVAGFGSPLGLLLGTRHFTATVSHFQVGECFTATCLELIRDANGMGSYDCSIRQGDETLAVARLSVIEKQRGRRLV